MKRQALCYALGRHGKRVILWNFDGDSAAGFSQALKASQRFLDAVEKNGIKPEAESVNHQRGGTEHGAEASKVRGEEWSL